MHGVFAVMGSQRLWPVFISSGFFHSRASAQEISSRPAQKREKH